MTGKDLFPEQTKLAKELIKNIKSWPEDFGKL